MQRLDSKQLDKIYGPAPWREVALVALGTAAGWFYTVVGRMPDEDEKARLAEAYLMVVRGRLDDMAAGNPEIAGRLREAATQAASERAELAAEVERQLG